MTDTTSAEACRAEFEKWIATNPEFEPIFLRRRDRSDNGYIMQSVELAWKSWQAAWNRRPAPQSQPDATLTDEGKAVWPVATQSGNTINIDITAYVAAARAEERERCLQILRDCRSRSNAIDDAMHAIKALT